ncbi:MAG TPA: class I SAM-dependent methyltransferase [Dehalococcoidia bacterium]|nr:class I SAM-dependent methyltransferase [Dehalococcoidia bacterium]
MGILYRLFRDTEEENKRRLLSLVEPRPGGRLLDLGCSDGSFTVRLARATVVAEAWGVEVAEAHAQRAREHGVRVVTADLNHGLPVVSRSFDIVHANQIIEHLTNTDGFMREIARALKPDGYALISTNNLASWHNIFSLLWGQQPMPAHVSSELILGNRLDPRFGQRHPAKEDSHLRTFSWSGLRHLAEYDGLEVEELTTAGYYPLPPAIARWFCRLDRWHGAFLILKGIPRRRPDDGVC